MTHSGSECIGLTANTQGLDLMYSWLVNPPWRTADPLLLLRLGHAVCLKACCVAQSHSSL